MPKYESDAERAARVNAARARQDKLHPPTPATASDDLRTQREFIALSLGAALTTSSELAARANDQDGPAGWARVRAADAKTELARSALLAFDTAHPEIVAAIRAEKAATLKSHEWD